jgi:hypothetical protein
MLSLLVYYNKRQARNLVVHFIIRAGLPKEVNNNDLIFIGKCVNFAVAIGEQAKSPNNIEVSENVYSNLEESAIYGVGVTYFL